VPADIADKEPAIHYWKGMVLAMTSPPLARMVLKTAYDGFRAQNDNAHALLAACAALESYFFEWGNWKEATGWVDLITTLVTELGEFPSLELEIRVISAAFAFIFPCPDHPLLPHWAKRAENLIASLEAPEPRISLSIFLITYHFICGEPRIARALSEEMAGLAVTHSRSPIFGIALTIWCGTCLWREGESGLAIDSLNKTLELANMSGLHQMDFYVYCHKLVAAQGAGDQTAAESYFKLMQTTQPAGMGAKQFFALASSGLYLMRGDLESGLRAATDAIGYFNETGWNLGAAMSHNAVALFLVLKSEYAKARLAIEATLEIARANNSCWMDFQSEMLLALCDVREGNKAQALQHLRYALQLGKEKGIRNYQLWWVPELMAELFALALENNIETLYVNDFIQRRQLSAPANAGPNWPWPLKIRTLGGFCIFKQGEPIKFERKAQKRILELIKAIAAGGGKGVSLDKLSTQLWEDADGDKAHNHCHVALHRARNLLESEQALLVSDGKVSFNPSVIWLDTWDLNQLVNDLERQSLTQAELEPALLRLNSLYLGAFLEGDSNEQWVLEQRERLAARFYRAVTQLGEQCEKLNQDALAVRLYSSVLDQLAPPESLYFRLMQCHQRLGHYVEAIAVYERLERLATASKRAPSAKIKALRDHLEKLARA